MIPKIIHVCWFGNGKMPAEHEEYIRQWKVLMPDFHIKMWTDDNVGELLPQGNKFVDDCLAQKKYVFLTDYVRFASLYKFGGIYLDTDVEVKKPFSQFLSAKSFWGFIFDSSVGTAIIGSEPGNKLMDDLLSFELAEYERTNTFEVSNNWVTKFFLQTYPEFRLNGKAQVLSDGTEFYPKDFFERYQVDKNSGGGFSEHHCAGAWVENKGNHSIKNIVKRILGRRLTSIIGHKLFLPKTPYYEVYKKHRKL